MASTYLELPLRSVGSLTAPGIASEATLVQVRDGVLDIGGPIKIKKNGTDQEVNKDTGVPANTVAVPVEIVSGSGTEINIVAGDIAIQTSAEGSNFDSMRIGDGTAKYAGITASNELKTSDAGATALLDIISQVDFSTQTKQDDLLAALPGLAQESTLAQISNKLDDIATVAETQPVSAASLPLPAGASTEAKQDTQITALADINTELDTQTTRLNLLATEAKQDTLIAKLPTALGQGTMAQSLKVVIASDQSAISTNSTQQTVSGSITSTQKPVGLTAVRATVSGSAPSATRKKVMFKPSISNSGRIWIGGSTVTTANGLEIVGPDRLEFAMDASDYYLISDTAAQTVEIVEIG